METTFKCLKCGHSDFETGQLRATGGFWTKLLNIQNLKFETRSCTQCGFTEIYKRTGSKTENVLDFFGN